MELRGLFQYLVNQLKKGEGVELVVLQVCSADVWRSGYVQQCVEKSNCKLSVL